MQGKLSFATMMSLLQEMKVIFIGCKLLLAIALLPIITACDNENVESMVIASFNIYVKFESPSGTNVLDSLNVKPTMPSDYRRYRLDDLTFDWKNKEDNLRENWKAPGLGWYNAEMQESSNPNFTFNGVGMVLRAYFTDISIWSNDNDKYPARDEEYTIFIKSKKIFGNETPHTIKYYVHIRGKAQFYAYKCEVDGKDYPFMGLYTMVYPEHEQPIYDLFVVIKTNK